MYVNMGPTLLEAFRFPPRGNPNSRGNSQTARHGLSSVVGRDMGVSRNLGVSFWGSR